MGSRAEAGVADFGVELRAGTAAIVTAQCGASGVYNLLSSLRSIRGLMKPKRLVSKSDGDFFSSFGQQIRLIIRLIADPRVSLWLKALPVFSLIYLISPLDIVIPLVDDAFVLWIANTLFLELCPPELVDEHRARLEQEAHPKKPGQPAIDEKDVIEARYKNKE